MSTRNLLCIVMVAAGAATMTACGSEGGSQGVIDARVLGLTGRPIVQPTDVIAQTVAQEKLTGECMSAGGFRYPQASIAEITAEQQESSYPYGFPTRADAARGVRGDSAREAEGKSIRLKDQYRKSLSDRRLVAYQTQLNGPSSIPYEEIRLPDGSTQQIGVRGCQGSAVRRLFGDVVNWKRVEATAYFVRIKIVQDTLSDPTFRAAAARWADCAKKAGVRESTPFAAASKARNAAVSRQDAVIDAVWNCEQSSRVVQIGLQLERQHAREVSATHERDLLAFRELSRVATERADRILAGS